MQITGYRLREAIRAHELRATMHQQQFENSLKAFPDEKKESPTSLAEKYSEAERAVARLQTAQARYNLQVEVEVAGEKMTLCEAVKRVGSAGRLEKFWREAASGGKKDRYSLGREDVRNTDEIRAVETISREDAGRLAAKAARFAGALRQAIAVANATSIDIKDLDSRLFE